MINPIYKLSEEQRKFAEKIGRKRNDAKDESFRYKSCGYKDPAFAHILGICAEIAYANITNRKLDENIYDIGDDSDFDGIEIKTATWKGDDIELKIKSDEYKRKKPLAYILARIDENYTTVEFVGSISREKFDKIKYEKRHKFVDNLCVCGNQMSKGLAFLEDDVLKIVKFEDA